MSNQIVVFKGHCGFGDRLQVLSFCMEYCIRHKATLCVDWRDVQWGQGDTDFADYFEIINIPIITIEEVVNKMKNGATIFPYQWTPDLMLKPITNDFYIKEHFRQPIFDTNLEIIHNENILVDICLNYRLYFKENLINNLKINSKIAPLIIDKLSVLEFPYTTVHIRGTDKMVNSISTIAKKYDELPIFCTKNVYLLGDDKKLLEEFVKIYPNCKIYDDTSPICKINNSTVGTHQLSKENLELYNITKHELNINTIYNFMIIVYSDWSIGNNNSYFWRMARYINDVGINKYSKWLNSYIPDYIPSTYKHIINYKELTAKKKNIYYRMRR